ncbi:hypothetical protein [Streptomyces sp. NBC_00829]|uniref:hypothetical protein n=1 Tax=Streptomyces sp. NBC_00829 TaxID=2903679 RepID=UPI00386A4A7E|nr:hypothetical protein OG293_03215 [Streptomyces sp. NBC_00829]
MTMHQGDDGQRHHSSREGDTGAASELFDVRKILIGPYWKRVQAELKKLARENRELREYIDTELHAVKKRMDEHDTRLDALSRARTQERRLVPAPYLDHQDIRTKINMLADQVLVDIAATTSATGDARKEAGLIGHIARRLFCADGPCPDADTLARQLLDSGHQVPPDRLRRACELAGEIRTEAEATGHTIVWDTTLAPGEELDPQRQQPHGGCDAEGVAEFVTVPGYLADGKAYVRQRVFTRPRQADMPEPSAAAPEADEPATQPSPGAVVLFVRITCRDVRAAVSESHLPSLQDLAAAIREARPGRTVSLSEVPTSQDTPRCTYIVLEADGNPACTIEVVTAREGAEVTIQGQADDAVALARWFHVELPGQHFTVSFQRIEPAPWANGWCLRRPDIDESGFRELLLGDEPET